MINKTSIVIKTIAIVGSMALLSSCAVITKSTEGSTETFQNTSDVSTDFTSSTSARDKDKTGKAQQVDAFAMANLDRLREDMARGGGEHLTAFSHLLGIRETHQTEFFAFAKQKYSVVFSSEPTTAKDMVARLNLELNDYPGWRQ